MGSFLVSGVCQVLTLGHGAGAKIRNVGGYVSCFGGLPGPNPRARGRSQNKKRRGLRLIFWVVSKLSGEGTVILSWWCLSGLMAKTCGFDDGLPWASAEKRIRNEGYPTIRDLRNVET